jgi:hypothetical protein
VLGFDELLAYLQARCDAGHSVPQLAAELGLSDWQVGAALARLAVRLAPRPQRLAAQRRRFTEERIAARVAALGFTDVEAHLGDRVVEHGWLLAEVAAELAAHRTSGGETGEARLPGSGDLPAGAARRAGVVGQADAGRASGRPQVAGGGAGPAGAATLTRRFDGGRTDTR